MEANATFLRLEIVAGVYACVRSIQLRVHRFVHIILDPFCRVMFRR